MHGMASPPAFDGHHMCVTRRGHKKLKKRMQPPRQNWLLEVQYFDDEIHSTYEGATELQWVSKFVHTGYMKKLFASKQAAAAYYDTHNPHMRTLNAHGTWTSDWDPITKLRYIPRVYHGERATISPFM